MIASFILNQGRGTIITKTITAIVLTWLRLYKENKKKKPSIIMVKYFLMCSCNRYTGIARYHTQLVFGIIAKGWRIFLQPYIHATTYIYGCLRNVYSAVTNVAIASV